MSKPGHAAKVSPLRRATALLLGVVTGLLLIEGLARAIFDEPVQPRFFVDPGYGVRGVKPKIDTRHHVPGEYDVRVRTNSVGMRGQGEYSVEKPPGIRRALIVGDSMGFGFGVEDDEVVSTVLEDLLNARGGPVRWEVLNQSVSGTGQAEQLVAYQAFWRNYRPDTVVLMYFSNDIGNNQVSGLYDAIGDTAVRRTGAGYLPAVRTQEMLYAVPPVRWLFEHSEAWNLIRNRLSKLVQDSKLKEQGLTAFDDTIPAGVALTRALLGEFTRQIRADGARPIILVIPDAGLASNFPLTAAEAEGLGATFADGHAFLNSADYYKLDGHLRASGHRKMAEELAAVLDK